MKVYTISILVVLQNILNQHTTCIHTEAVLSVYETNQRVPQRTLHVPHPEWSQKSPVDGTTLGTGMAFVVFVVIVRCELVLRLSRRASGLPQHLGSRRRRIAHLEQPFGFSCGFWLFRRLFTPPLTPLLAFFTQPL